MYDIRVTTKVFLRPDQRVPVQDHGYDLEAQIVEHHQGMDEVTLHCSRRFANGRETRPRHRVDVPLVSLPVDLLAAIRREEGT